MLRTLTGLLLAGGLFFASLPSTTNYELNSYGFGSGGTANSTTTTYGLEGITGELSGETATTTNYQAQPGYIETQQANVPKVTLSNPSNYYDKLLFVIDQQNNPSDALYALQVCVGADWSGSPLTCGGTTMYVKSDDTLGATLTTADYQTYSAWGGGGGTTIIGLNANTTYYIRAKATQGKYTESAYGPSSSAATVGQSISFCLYTSDGNCSSSSHATSFSGMVAGAVTTASNNLDLAFATNADNGGNVYIYSKNGALQSATIPSGTINSVSSLTDLSSASQGYGAQGVNAIAGFPSTPVLDNFNRTNSTGLGSNWSTVSGGFVDFNVASNVAHDPNGVSYSWDYWNPTTFGPDSEAFATVASASSDPRRVCARFDPVGRNGYCVQDTTSTWSILKDVSGSTSTIGATATQAVAVGDKIGIKVTGSSPATIEAWYYNSSTSAWTQLFTRTDSSFTGANYIAMESRGSDLDDFGGGTVTNSAFTILSPYTGTGNSVGPLNQTISTIFTTGGPLTGGTATISLQAKPTNLTPAASDYSDTITVIAAASF